MKENRSNDSVVKSSFISSGSITGILILTEIFAFFSSEMSVLEFSKILLIVGLSCFAVLFVIFLIIFWIIKISKCKE
jgi:hypothetical protein